MSIVSKIRSKKSGLIVLVALLVFGISAMASLSAKASNIISKETDDETEIRYRILGPLPMDDERLVSHVRKYYIHPPSNKPYNLSKGDNHIYARFSKESTWRYIHQYLETLFTGEGPGFFVEAGALDGEFISNTLWLEQILGWTGLLIEPDQESFRHLLSKNRQAWASHTCLSNKPFPKETIHVSLQIKTDNDLLKVPWNHHSNAHELGVEVKTSNPSFMMVSDKTYSVVQCFPLITYLKALKITTIDFLSLDIQGSERDVLKNLPWDSIRIRVLVVEIVADEIDKEFVRFMEEKGYVLMNKKLVLKVQDYIYIRKDENRLLEKLYRVYLLA